MKKKSILTAFFLFSSALAGSNEPLQFEWRPSQFHVYLSDPQQEVVLTLMVRRGLGREEQSQKSRGSR